MEFTFKTIATNSVSEYKDRGSKFIGLAFPIADEQDFKERLKETKKLHPKATHYCFAYRIGTKGENFRINDNGEPSGTAGFPILGQIDYFGLTNILVIVVRYFGGTLLGRRGLIDAYKTASTLALENNKTLTKDMEKYFWIEFDYTKMNLVLQILKESNCSILNQNTQLFCSMDIGIPLRDITEITKKLHHIEGLELRMK